MKRNVNANCREGLVSDVPSPWSRMASAPCWFPLAAAGKLSDDLQRLGERWSLGHVRGPPRARCGTSARPSYPSTMRMAPSRCSGGTVWVGVRSPAPMLRPNYGASAAPEKCSGSSHSPSRWCT